MYSCCILVPIPQSVFQEFKVARQDLKKLYTVQVTLQDAASGNLDRGCKRILLLCLQYVPVHCLPVDFENLEGSIEHGGLADPSSWSYLSLEQLSRRHGHHSLIC